MKRRELTLGDTKDICSAQENCTVCPIEDYCDEQPNDVPDGYYEQDINWPLSEEKNAEPKEPCDQPSQEW